MSEYVGHILRVPTRVHSIQRCDTDRWCYVCRKRRQFTFTVHVPVDPMSYYGPHLTFECSEGHVDGDCFPGTWREGGDA